jgi:hypothetical protein
MLTQLKKVTLFFGNDGIFSDAAATEHFVSTLQRTKSSVQELQDLPMIFPDNLPNGCSDPTYARIKNTLARNQQLNRVDLLLLAKLAQQQQQRSSNSSRPVGTMLLKTWNKAIAKFAAIHNNAGASAIFNLFTARPAILEKRLTRRPAATAAAAVAVIAR